MIKKRFINKGNDIFQHGEWWCSAGGEHCAEVIVTTLNELSEKFDQFDFLLNENKHMKDVLEQNHELKRDNQKLRDELEFWRLLAKQCPNRDDNNRTEISRQCPDRVDNNGKRKERIL